MRLLAGRNFTSADMGSSHAVAIVNQTFARRFFPGLNPIGRAYLDGVLPAEPVEVVGLVEDSKYFSLREENLPTAFVPLNRASELGDRDTLELHTAIPPSRLIVPVLAAVAEVSSGIPLEFQILADQVNDSLVQERLSALLSGFFGALVLILAMIGLYGTFSYLQTQRQIEFGVRMALGAEPASTLALRHARPHRSVGWRFGCWNLDFAGRHASTSTNIVWPRAARHNDNGFGSWCSIGRGSSRRIHSRSARHEGRSNDHTATRVSTDSPTPAGAVYYALHALTILDPARTATGLLVCCAGETQRSLNFAWRPVLYR